MEKKNRVAPFDPKILGINVAPVLYQYNHNISVFKYPQLKFGFRF